MVVPGVSMVPGFPRPLLLAAALLAGCVAKPPPPPPPTEITGTVRAAANVNPSVSRRPSPLLMRVYELKSATAFNNADFVSLYQRDQAELGAELVGRQELILNPGDTRPLAPMGSPETRFVGVVAGYRDLDRARWRSVVAIEPGRKQRIVVNAEELSVSVGIAR